MYMTRKNRKSKKRIIRKKSKNTRRVSWKSLIRFSTKSSFLSIWNNYSIFTEPPKPANDTRHNIIQSNSILLGVIKGNNDE